MLNSGVGIHMEEKIAELYFQLKGTQVCPDLFVTTVILTRTKVCGVFFSSFVFSVLITGPIAFLEHILLQLNS